MVHFPPLKKEEIVHQVKTHYQNDVASETFTLVIILQYNVQVTRYDWLQHPYEVKDQPINQYKSNFAGKC